MKAKEKTRVIGRGKKPGCGRPRKFHEASRVITLTLPDRTLQDLASIHADRAKAIVHAVDAMVRTQGQTGKPLVELVEVADGMAIILVAPNVALRSIPWLRLVEVAPGRHLLVIPCGTRAEELELAIVDQLEALPRGSECEREMLEQLRTLMRSLRQDGRIHKSELLLVSSR